MLTLLALAFLIRLALAPRLMITSDLVAYERWGLALRDHFLDFYSYALYTPGIGSVPIYLPLASYLFGIVDAIYFHIAHLLGHFPSENIYLNVSLRAFLRVPGTLTDVATVALLYFLARRRLSARWALGIAATYAFSPAILVDLLGWGQTDGIILLPALLALVYTLRGHGAWVGLLFAVSVLFKPQAIILLPLSLLYLYRWGNWRAVATAFAALTGTALLVWLPYLLPPHPQIFAWRDAVTTVLNIEPQASHDAYNLWWLLGVQWHSDITPLMGPFSAKQVGLVLFVGIMVLVLIGIWREATPKQLWLGAAVVTIGYYDVMTSLYDRYLFPAIALFLIASLYNRHAWAIYAIVSVTACLSMVLPAIELNQVLIGQTWVSTTPWIKALSPSYFAISRSIAAVNVALMIWAIGLYTRGFWPAASARPVQRSASVASFRAR